MELGLTTAVYIAAALLFILSLAVYLTRKRKTCRLVWYFWHGFGRHCYTCWTRKWFMVAFG